MATKRYDIFLDGKFIVTTDLEKADAPMGAASGIIHFTDAVFGYHFLRGIALRTISHWLPIIRKKNYYQPEQLRM